MPMRAVIMILLSAIFSPFGLAQPQEDTLSFLRRVVIEADQSATDVVCFFCSARIDAAFCPKACLCD